MMGSVHKHFSINVIIEANQSLFWNQQKEEYLEVLLIWILMERAVGRMVKKIVFCSLSLIIRLSSANVLIITMNSLLIIFLYWFFLVMSRLEFIRIATLINQVMVPNLELILINPHCLINLTYQIIIINNKS